MVEGQARTAAETWDFRWQAISCDEPSRLVSWLRAVSDAAALGDTTSAVGPGRAAFTEPNFALEVDDYRDGLVVIRVELDLEFRAPSNELAHDAGAPSLLMITQSPRQLAAATADLESDVSRYPDGLAAYE